MKEAAIDTTSVKVPTVKDIKLSYLPSFAAYIKDHHLRAYVTELMKLSREVQLPFLKYLAHLTDEQIIELGIQPHTEFLTAVAENRLKETLEESLGKWVSDNLGLLKKDELTAEDITLGTYIRKRGLSSFIPAYTQDIQTAMAIMREIDDFSVISDTASTNVFLDILRETIEDQLIKEKEITAKLKLSEKQLRKAQDIANIGYWSWNLLTDEITWSDTMYRMYGIPLGTPLTFELIVAHHDEGGQQIVKQQLTEAIKLKQSVEAHYDIYTADGTIKILLGKTEPFTDEKGEVVLIEGIVQDVTERQQLITRLQLSDHLYKQAQAMSHIGNWWWDLTNDHIEWSDELYRIYDLEPQSVDLRTVIGQYIHPDDKEAGNNVVQQAIRNREPYDIIYRITTRTGKNKFLHAMGGVEVVNGEAVKLVGTVQDITAHKLTEDAVSEYKDFIEKIANVTPSLIAAYNIHTGKYSFINAAFQRLLGYPASRVMEEGLAFMTTIVHPDDLPVIMERNNEALAAANALPPGAEEPVNHFKYRIRNNKGEYRWFHTYGTVFERNASGKVESVLNISVDITAQEAAEQALFAKNIELEKSNQSLEEYAYVASHDLKEPLRKISTFCDRIIHNKGTVFTKDSQLYMDKVLASAHRMQNMVDDLLAVATISGNKAFEQCDLNDVLRDAIQSLEHKIEETGTRIEAQALPTAFVVKSQFRQLFQNLISNSMKFARKGVAPSISINYSVPSSRDLDGLSSARRKDYIKLEIKDNGIGFDDQYAENIFAIFKRLHGKTEYEGTGIGLAICKKIAENHNGLITASGVPGEGATFTIVFPANH